MSALDRAIEKIRHKKAIIFAGSGMSIYAGCPSGKKLVQIIKDKMSADEQKNVENVNTLPEIAQEFVDLQNGSRSDLIAILKEYINIDYKDIHIHKWLLNIPQIKNIITTNYDTIFEKAYENKINVIYNDYYLPQINSNLEKVNLFKIHGDFTRIENILITKDDFDKFFINLKANLIWNRLISLLVSYSIIFIGYELDDPNIRIIYKEILEKMKNHINENYFINPNISKQRETKLAGQKISAIQMKAEEFFQKVRLEIYNNVYGDVKKQIITPKEADIILQSKGIFTEYKYKNEEVIISRIGSSTKNLTQNKSDGSVLDELSKTKSNNFEVCEIDHKDLKGNFTIRTDNKENIQDFLNGKSLDPLIINSEELKSFNASINDIQIIDNFNNKPSELILTHLPVSKYKATLLLKKSGNEIENVKVETYRFGNKFLFKFIHNQFSLTLTFTLINNKFDTKNIDFSLESKLQEVRFGEKLYNFLYEFGNEDPFIIEIDKNHSKLEICTAFFKKENQKEFEFVRDIFSKLRFIEKESGMYFNPPFTITKADVNIINRLYLLLKDKKMLVDKLSFSVKYNYQSKGQNYLLSGKPFDIMLRGDNIETYEILNLKIQIRINAYILSAATLINLEDVKKQIEQKKPTIDLKVKEETGKANVVYEIVKN
jgi:hypothetical protein